MTESFPRLRARTRRFTLGLPRSFQISPGGNRVAFLRSRGGGDPVNCLWVLDVATGAERLVADPAALGGAAAGPAGQEKARRERVREQAVGFVADLSTGQAPRAIAARPGAFDPRPDPAGRRVAYACDGAVRVVTLDTDADSLLIGPDGTAGVTYGLAEFVAAEEMGRTRGFWWAPDGTALLVARVDETPVPRWYIADPANPGRAPATVAYPAAGTANAEVSLLLAGLDGGTVPVDTGRGEFPYLVAVT